MTRQEFIITLRSELKKLPPEEIVAATEFFEEYFDEVLESGERTEEEILQELGNPKRVAAQIKADYAARILDGDETILNEKTTVKKKLSAVWWVIIGIVSAPVSIPLACGLAFVGFWVFFGLLGFVLGIYALIILGAVLSVAAFVMGILAIGPAVTSGILFLGFGFIGAAITAAAGVGAFIGTKELIKAIARAFRRGREKHKLKKLGKMATNISPESEWSFADDDAKADMKKTPGTEMTAGAEMAGVPAAYENDDADEAAFMEEIAADEKAAEETDADAPETDAPETDAPEADAPEADAPEAEEEEGGEKHE